MDREEKTTGILQRIRNYIGGSLGYCTSPVSGNTFWSAKLIGVPVTNLRPMAIVAKDIQGYSPEQIAEGLIKNRGSTANIFPGERTLAREEIARAVREHDYSDLTDTDLTLIVKGEPKNSLGRFLRHFDYDVVWGF